MNENVRKMVGSALVQGEGASGAPRIAPGGRAEIGVINDAIVTLIGVPAGGRASVFTTLARHRKLFRRWLWFAAALMPGGRLPRADTELVILRVAHNAGSDYEWEHHRRLARLAGLSEADIDRVHEGPGADGWSPRQRVLLAAADELHAERDLSDERWAELAGHLGERELIEFLMLVGHYEMLAMTLNALRVQPDAPGREPPRLIRAAHRFLAARGAGS